MRNQNLTQFFNIFCALNKAHRYIIKIARCTKLKIRKIFLGNNITAKISIWQVNALMAHNKTFVFDTNLNRSCRRNLNNSCFYFTIEERNWLANFYFLSQVILYWQNITALLFYGIIKNKFIANMHIDMIVIYIAKTNLWTLQILQNCDRFATLSSIFANNTNLLVTLIISTVTKIEAKTIYARIDHLF